MRSHLLGSIILATALFLSGPARATQVSYVTGTCPLGGGPVKVYTQLSADSLGGYDSDTARYSTHGEFREYAVSTCPDNLFSLYGRDMDHPVDPELVPKLERALKQAVAELSDPNDPPVWERYGIAAKMYEVMGRGPLFLADLYLQASWTARDHAVGVYIGLQGPRKARETLSKGKAELARDLSPRQRKLVLYNLARVAERGGFIAERDAYLVRFAAENLDSEEQAALHRFEEGIAAEPHYQDLAIAQYRKALAAGHLPHSERLRATYLLADLLRRRGQLREARREFQKVLSSKDLPDDLRAMAQFLAQELAN